jgi:hypothetical protein
VLWWFVTVLGERPSLRGLAEQAGTGPMMTSQVVRALERRGLRAALVVLAALEGRPAPAALGPSDG